MSPSSSQRQVVAGRYLLVEALGQGGMGRVWRARDEVLHRDVAIKEIVPPPGLTDQERQEMRERSLREARAIAQLSHTNAVRVFDVLRTDGDPWIVMEYVPSRSLHEVLALDGPVTQQRAAEIGLGVLAALRAVHQAGVVHRDVKPGNVLLGHDGRVVLTDFGLATVPGDPNVTRTGMVLGSPAYISPERARTGIAGPEADLWSLGATVFAAVEGQSPYARGTAIATLTALASEPPPPVRNATGPLKTAVAGLLRKDPGSRMKADEAEQLFLRAIDRRQRGLSFIPVVRRAGLIPRQDRSRDAADAAPVGPVPPAVAQPPVNAAAEATTAAPTYPPPSVAPARVPQPRSTSDDENGPVPTATAKETTTTRVDLVVAEQPPAPVGGSAPEPLPEKLLSMTATTSAVRVGAGRRRWAGVALIAAVVAVGVSVRLAGGDDPSTTPVAAPTGAGTPTPAAAPAPSAVASSAPTAAPTTPAPAAFVLPKGWHTYKGSRFSIPVPDDWSTDRDGGMILFKEQGGLRRVLGIYQSDESSPEPVAALAEEERQQSKSKYRRLKLGSVDYRGYRAADWEYLYNTGSGTRVHVLRRGFIASGRYYTISWYVADDNWQENLRWFNTVADGFKAA
ncbi:serine/threonine-protein kinase [Catellatospora sp. KI3]|uniref:serine/threonine-protein kinase n=1 Tax=Catellatospora sp. KI3 TaxID=3041620 RepID=UPI0024822F5D|nr:serine/threonine-protein kinase [Catellatospora sp. KI3]MDI1460858.1 serine/threonine-protein kinase [Catellatospora sp. KI3]